MKNEKMNKFNKLYPLYAGLSADLLFWIAIDTLFLTVVKGLSASQISLLTSISTITCIILQIPFLKVIKKIGNTNSVRLGSLMMLISSLLLTFGPNYIFIALGKIFYEMSFTFQNMSSAILKNNLEIQDRDKDYIEIKTKANTIYAAVTMIISFIASPMFNINHYLPMICCILFCTLCFILSFNIIDFSKFDKTQASSKKKTKLRYSKIVILLIVSYSLFYPIVNSGQSEGKLFIQQQLLLDFDVETTALIIGGILSASRIIRLISNILFNKIYRKYKEKVGIILPVLLAISIILMIVGSFIPNLIVLKIIVMSLGYVILLFIRDPFKVYNQDLALNSVDKDKQQSLLTLLELGRRIVRAIVSLSFTAILVHNPMITVIVTLLLLSIIEIIVSIRLYKLIKGGE